MIHPLLVKVDVRPQPRVGDEGPGGRPVRDECEGTRTMESNARYYSRRAVEERMKAQRAITEAARTWHAKLAHDFAERATSCAAEAGITAATAAIRA